MTELEFNIALTKSIDGARQLMHKTRFDEALAEAQKGLDLIMKKLDSDPTNKGLNLRRLEFQKLCAGIRLAKHQKEQ